MKSSAQRMMLAGSWLVLLVIFAVLAGFFIRSDYLLFLLISFLLYCVYTIALNLVMGYAGQFAISNPAFMALGAYFSAALIIHFGWSFWTAVLLAIGVAAVVATFLGYITLRYTTGIYLNIITLAIVGVAQLLIKLPVIAPYTAGVNGLTTNYPVWVGPLAINSLRSWYFLMLAVVAVIAFLAYRLVHSRTGRAWVALRENEMLARSLGVRPTYFKTLSFVLSACIAAFGGALSAPIFKFISEGSFNIEVAIMHCVMLFVGGIGSLAGPFLGSAIFLMVPELLRPIAELRMAVFGLILIMVMVFMRGGVFSFLKRYLGARWKTYDEALVPACSAAPTAPFRETGGGNSSLKGHHSFSNGFILMGKSLTKEFGGIVAVNKVELHLREGEILGLIGPNGAGKSTLLKLLSGFETLTGGEVVFRGENVSGIPAERRSERGIVRTFQEVGVFPELTVWEHMMIARHLQGKTGLFFDLFGGSRLRQVNESNRREVVSLLEMCGLREHAHTIGRNLSYGEMKKLSIAMALATKPRVLLLDEATAGLSAEETESIARVIRTINASGVTIIVVEHNVPFITGITHRVIVLDLGSKIAEGSPEEIVKDDRVITAYLGG